MLVTCLEDESEPLAKTKLVRMDLPGGAKIKENEYGVTIACGAVNLEIYPIDKESLESNVATYRLSESHPMFVNQGMVIEVEFGSIAGIKFVKGPTPAFQKKIISYQLEVPGGCVSATMHSQVGEFDESLFECHFHSLRIEERSTTN